MLRVDDLTKTYKTGDKALTDVTFTCPRGRSSG
jgi:ABC-type Na+ transport system ATPase subunit NatA